MKATWLIVFVFCGACGSCDEADVQVLEPDEPQAEPNTEEIESESEVRQPSASGEELCASSSARWCVPAGQGAWVLDVESTPADCGMGNIPESGERGRMRINYLTQDGQFEGEWDEFDECEATVELSSLGHFDWDGDGHDELVVRRRESYLDGGESTAWIQTYSNSAIERFTELPDESREVFELRDADEDGRLDIVTRGPHQRGPRESDCCSNVYSGGPMTLWHSLSDGTFTRSDGVALAHIREQCGDTQRPLLGNALAAIAQCFPEEVWGDVESAVTCARLAGNDVAQTRDRVRAEVEAYQCPEGFECCSELDSLEDDIARLAENVNTDVTLN